ncbi:MAG: tetratricopeptide repeat protein [bacterium]|nr:tetratricopeptide repeat protein [bacterium]
MSHEQLAAFDPVASLLGDLDTITTLAQSAARPPGGGGLIPGETRPAAILLVDIVGFTPLAQLLGAEALSHLVDRCFRIFDLTVQAHGGYCDKLIGDAGLYVFPGHLSYEPPCQGALRSALEIQRRVGQINEALVPSSAGSSHEAATILVRCGVSFGEVTRQRIGGAEQQFTVMGSAVNLAQRLESNALPGTVCTVAEVLDETGNIFAHERRGSFELKGLGQRELFTVTAERVLPVQLRGRGQISPLVGRDALLDDAAGVVTRWLRAVEAAPARPEVHVDSSSTGRAGAIRTNSGHLLILRGPTAVGKSRLAWELTKRLATDFPLVAVTAHCTPHGGLLGFAAELCKVAGLTADNVVQRWAELCMLSRDAELSASHLPLLAYVLGSSAVDSAAIRQGDSSAFSAACKAALSACIELTTHEGRQPLLVVEDIQWLGELVDVLAHLLNEVRLETPLVVIATARPAVGDAEIGRLGCGTGLHLIDVTALSLDQGRDLLAALLPGATLPDALEAELHEKSLGLPYYYEEAARLLLRTGVVVPITGGTGVTAGVPLSDQREPPRDSEVSVSAGLATTTSPDTPAKSITYTVVGTLDSLPIPSDLRTLILGRLDTLPPLLRELAQHASVLGRSFELDMLLKLEQHVGGMSADDVHAALSALHDERILHADLGGATDADTETPRYFFTHVLTRDAAYASLLSVNKRRLHGAAADALKPRVIRGSPEERDLLPVLYEHQKEACRWLDAHKSCCEVLEQMNFSADYSSWNTWEGRATSHWYISQEVTDSPSLLRVRAFRLLRLNRTEEAKDLLGACIGVSSLRGDNEGYKASNTLAAILIRQGSYGEARTMLVNALAVSQQCGDKELESVIWGNIGICFQRQGDVNAALDAYHSGLAVAEKCRHIRSLGSILGYLAAAEVEEGHLDQALGHFREGLLVAIRMQNKHGVANTLADLGMVCRERGDFRESAEYFRAAKDAIPDGGSPNLESRLYAEWGELHRVSNNLPEALNALEQACTVSTGHKLPALPVYLSARAEIKAVSGDRDGALQDLRLSESCLEFIQCDSQELVLRDCYRASTLLALGRVPEGVDLSLAIEASVHEKLVCAPNSDIARKLAEIRITRQTVVEMLS